MDFQDQKTAPTEKVARNPNNANILKGGKVDPRSQLYQRSVAGREQLKDYLSRLSNSGKDEADVFMAGVKSLMNRGHGYVGAYLDSKNPGRRYEKNQAMAITDKVMTDEGIGENPGARLTRPKVEDEEGNIDKEATKEARDKRKEANAGRGSGPQQAPGPSAKPVGQQRKEGKRESTGEALEDSRRDTKIGDSKGGPVYQPVSKGKGSGSVDVERKWQQEMESGFRKIKTDLKNGAITPEEAKSQISELNSRSKEFVNRGKQEREQGLKDDAAVYKRREDRKKQRDGGQPPTGEAPADGGQPPSGGAQPPADGGQPPAADAEIDEKTANAPEGESAKRVEVDDFTKNSVIKKNVIDFLNGRSNLAHGKKLNRYMLAVSKGQEDPEYLSELFDGISNEISDSYREETDINLDPNSIKDSILGIIRSNKDAAKKFGASLESIQSTPRSAPGGQESTGPEPTAPAPGEQEATGPEPTATPEAKPGQQETPTAPSPAPTAAPKTPRSGLNVPAQPARKSGGGVPFTPEVGKQAKGNIRQAVSKGLSPQEAVEQFINGNLFGQTAIETGSAATNPLEDSPPDQYERFRGDPAEKYKGAQEGGRELPTAGRGQEGQGSLLKKGTMEARGDFRKGAKPKPSRPAQPGPKSYEQTGLFGKDDFKSDQGGEPAPTESAPPDETKPSESPGQKTFLSKAKGKETQILPSAIQVPKPGQGVTDAESYTRQLRDAKIPTPLINETVKKTYGTKPRGKARSKGPKVNNSAEYQEFAQSVRSMMR